MHFYKFLNIVFDDKVQSELIVQDPVNVPEKIETLDINIEVKKILAASLSAVALSTVKPAENTPEHEEKNKLMNEIKEFVQLKALRLQAFCTSSKKGVREAEGPSLKTLGMPSAPLPAYFNEDGDENRYVRDDVENVRDDSHEDDGVRSTTLDGIDLGDLPPQGRALALHPEEVQPCEPFLQDRALACDAVLGELALQDRALASSASAAVLGDLPQQARALAAAAVLGELAEQDRALASSHAAGLYILKELYILNELYMVLMRLLLVRFGGSLVLCPCYILEKKNHVFYLFKLRFRFGTKTSLRFQVGTLPTVLS